MGKMSEGGAAVRSGLARWVKCQLEAGWFSPGVCGAPPGM